MKTEKFEADILCVGGGIAGLMAAIRAADLGANVIVAEEVSTLRSRDAGMGNDHFVCYIPEVHGPDIEPFVKEQAHGSRFGGLIYNSYGMVMLIDHITPQIVKAKRGRLINAEHPLL